MARQEFKSGQHVRDGLVEFDTTETFVDPDGGVFIHQPGHLSAGDTVKVHRYPDKTYRVVGKRMEGRKLVIICEPIRVAYLDMYVRYESPDGLIKGVFPVEAICRHKQTNAPEEYLLNIRNTLRWANADYCLPVKNPNEDNTEPQRFDYGGAEFVLAHG